MDASGGNATVLPLFARSFTLHVQINMYTRRTSIQWAISPIPPLHQFEGRHDFGQLERWGDSFVPRMFPL
jgi:hypothetical protein